MFVLINCEHLKKYKNGVVGAIRTSVPSEILVRNPSVTDFLVNEDES